VRHSEKKQWTAPEIRPFNDADEVWEHYKSRGSTGERTRLRVLLDLVRRRKSEADDERPRRRA
jgi:hypothetical protein